MKYQKLISNEARQFLKQFNTISMIVKFNESSGKIISIETQNLDVINHIKNNLSHLKKL